MFRFLAEKMLKNRWLTISLLAGYTIAVAIVSSLPIYSNAVLNRMLRKDLETSQVETGVYPGRVSAVKYLATGDNEPHREQFLQYDGVLQNEILPSLKIPVQENIVYTAAKALRIYRPETDRSKNGALAACSGLFDQITLLDGRLPDAEETDGICEAIVSERAAYQLGVSLDGIYDVYQPKKIGSNEDPALLTKVKVVGVYTAKDPASLYWVMPLSTFDGALLMDPSLFTRKFVEADDAYLNYIQWACALDYTKLSVENSGEVAEAVSYYTRPAVYPPALEVAFAATYSKYEYRRQQLTGMLWVIQTPILLMLLFYIFMVTRLILEHEQNEIAILRSRGAFRRQITGLSIGQSGILAFLALIIGPLLSLFFCQIIGASNGFLEFVNRAALPLSMTVASLVFAVVTAIILVFTMLCALFFQKEGSIVAVKRRKSRRFSTPLWQKCFLDVICLAVSLYGLYNFQNRLNVVHRGGVAASDVPVDFLLYGSSTLFILGAALLFLRIFPYLIRLIYRMGQKRWGPVLYLTLINISRSGGGNQIISLFLIFTLSMGVFNAVTVRTINQNGEERIRYSVGADIALQEKWDFSGGLENPDLPLGVTTPIHYSEPTFSRYQNMETVSNVARVRVEENIPFTAETTKAEVTLMGIVPDEFGKVCWFRSDLLPYHINEYLNLLAQEPQALLLSRKFMEDNGLSPGDTVYLTVGTRSVGLGSRTGFPFVVYAGIDFFPSYNPRTDGEEEAVLAVANLYYLESITEISPYQVWMRKADGATSAMVYEELEEMSVPITSLSDADADVIRMKNDAMMQGLNGYFTLSFLVTMLITFVGFFIYWILTIQGRMLQFGILRSMGLSRLSVILALFWEQIFVSVTAIVAGIGLGALSAILFGPILESNVNLSEQILPFQVVAYPEDYGRIVLIVGMILVIAAVVLSRIICRMRINEALKLGED